MKAFYFFILSLILANQAYSLVNVNHTQLSNGMNVYVIENHRTPIVSHMIVYHVGGVNDPRGQSGLAHFLEHLMFRGTRKVQDISSIIHKNGGIFNASTSSYYTNYFETIPKDKLELIMELESDRMRNIEITEDAVIAERKIVAEERRMRIENSPAAQLEEEMLSAFYHNNTGWQVAGWLDEIMTLNKEKADFLYNRFYHPNNAVLIIAGDTTFQEVIPLAEKYYGVIPPRSDIVFTTEQLYEPKHKADVVITFEDTKVKQQKLILWYKAPNIKDVHSLPLKLGSIILGHGKSSYLYKELILKNLATHINVSYDFFVKGDSIFDISIVSNHNLPIVKKTIIEVVNRIASIGITENDLKRAKNILKAALTYNSESPVAQSNFYANMIIAGGGIKCIDNEIDKIDIKQVNDALLEILHNKNNITGYLIPKEQKNVE